MPAEKRATDDAEKRAADGAADQPEPADQAAAENDDTALEDLQVLWRKKAQPQAAATADASAAGGDADARLSTEQARAEDYFNRWQRAAADMANMRRRHEQDRQEYLKQANAALIGDLLPVLDSFDRALDTVPEAPDQTWVDGVRLVERQLKMVLQRHGLNPIEAHGKPFDPTEHEALMHEPSDEPEDTVTGELQRGYKLHERVLRPAMVKVAKKAD